MTIEQKEGDLVRKPELIDRAAWIFGVNMHCPPECMTSADRERYKRALAWMDEQEPLEPEVGLQQG